MVILFLNMQKKKKCHFCAADNHHFELFPFDAPQEILVYRHIPRTSLFEFDYTELPK